MALKYTGRADVLVVDGKAYRRGGGEGFGDLDRVQISKARAAQLMAGSRLHRFEDADGQDVFETETAPAAAPTTPAQAEATKRS